MVVENDIIEGNSARSLYEVGIFPIGIDAPREVMSNYNYTDVVGC